MVLRNVCNDRRIGSGSEIDQLEAGQLANEEIVLPQPIRIIYEGISYVASEIRPLTVL